MPQTIRKVNMSSWIVECKLLLEEIVRSNAFSNFTFVADRYTNRQRARVSILTGERVLFNSNESEESIVAKHA